MARTAVQLTIAKNEVAAETVAATILDLLTGAVPASARDVSAYRMLRKHALELFEVAGLEGDDLSELTNAARTGGEGGDTARLRDELAGTGAYSNGQA